MNDRKGKTTAKTKGLTTKTISMPTPLFMAANEKISNADDLNWSRYVKNLIRQDLNTDSKPLAA